MTDPGRPSSTPRGGPVGGEFLPLGGRRADVAPAAPERVRSIRDAVRTRDRALELEARARFLAEASRILASSLDVDTTLATVVRLAVPLLGDWCLIDLAAEHGAEHDGARRLAAAHADPDRDAAARAFAQLGPDDEPVPCGAPRVLRAGTTELTPCVDPATVAAVRDPRRRALLAELGVRAQLCVPLVARGHALGAFTFVLGDPARAFTPDDVALAEDLAQRAAVAVDNARLYEEAQRASAAKSAFLGVVSHEFRTPLQAVIGYTDMLRLGIPVAVPPEARSHVDRIAAASEHLLHLVEQLLSSARLGAGRDRVDAEPTDVATLARELVLLVEPLAAARGLRFVTDVPHGGIPLVTDVGKVRQILYNLLANAVKFTDRGEVTLHVRRVAGPGDDRVACEVRDTGIGIAGEHLARVFDPFWQVERPGGGAAARDVPAARPQRRSGTGLGLSISRDLARLLGGELLVRSTVGRGTTFTLVLPVSPPAAPAATVSER